MRRLARLIAWLLSALLTATPAAAQGVDRKTVNEEKLQNRAWNLHASEFHTGVNLTLPDPTLAPTGVEAAAGSCTNANGPYRVYIAWANASGITALSPASGDVTTTGASKNISTTRTEALPSGATGWLIYWSRNGAGESHSIKRLCSSSSAQGQLKSGSTFTTGCTCTSTGAQHPGLNQTGWRGPFSTYAATAFTMFFGQTSGNGTDVGTLTEPTRMRINTSTKLPEVSIDNGGTWSTIAYTNSMPTVIDICPTCAYTTLGAACAANTSTCASPIKYRLAAGAGGSYTSSSEQSCSGEACMTIEGAGPFSTVLVNTATGAGDYAVINIGNSSDVTIRMLKLKGHRGVIGDFAGASGGRVIVEDVIVETNGTDPDEDCGFFRDAAAGTEYHIRGADCTCTTDCWTNISGATEWYMGPGNIIKSTASSATGGTGGGYAMQAIPQAFIDRGTVFDMGRGATGAATSVQYAYWFNGGLAAGGNGTECTSGCFAVLQSPTIRIANTDTGTDNPTIAAVNVANPNSGCSGAGVPAGCCSGVGTGTCPSHLAALSIYNADIAVSTTAATNGVTYGIFLQNGMTAQMSGGKIRTSGGTLNIDVNEASGTVQVNGVDYQSGGGSALDIKNVLANGIGSFGIIKVVCYSPSMPTCNSGAKGQIVCDGDGTIGLCFCDGTNWKQLQQNVSSPDCS